MNPIKKYLAQAKGIAGERMLNADGMFDGSLHFPAAETSFGADGSLEQANGQSQPYIINISNASAAAVTNFDVLGAVKYLFSAGWNGGSLTISGVTISSGIANVTYQELLAQTQTNPFTVGTTYLSSLAGSNSQLLQPITIDTKDGNGNQASKAIIPTYDPYQNLANVVLLKQQYRIDGATRLVFSAILPSVMFQVQFYPADNINLARGLAGAAVSKQFQAPQITR